MVEVYPSTTPPRGVSADGGGSLDPHMLPSWHEDLESMEKISQDGLTRDLLLRMAALEQAGKLGPFLFELAADDDLDETTKGNVVEIAQDPTFLFAVEDYLHRTEIFH